MFYKPFGEDLAYKMKFSEVSECGIEVYSKYKEPAENYYIIGTCYYNPDGLKLSQNDGNIAKLQTCACLTQGDAILIFSLEEEMEIQYFPGSLPQGPQIISTPGGDVKVGSINPGTSGAFVQVLTQEIKASVIKFGVRPEVDIPY
jgi:hypothetical protein